MIDFYKCSNTKCGIIKEAGSDYYQVKIISGDNLLFIPTCSIECAEIVKDNNYNLHKNKANDVKNQVVQRMIW